MSKEDDGPNAKQLPETERKFNQEQYDMLLRCSEGEKTKKEKDERGLWCNKWQYKLLKVCATDDEGIEKWNEWREKNLNTDIFLEGADLQGCYLKGIRLHSAGVEFEDEWSERKWGSDVYLKRADLSWANLENGGLLDAHLESAMLWFAHLEKADISHAHLEGAQFQRASVDGVTSLWECKVDHRTNFLGVGLDVAKIDPGTKQLLEYNIRRMNWEEWYKEHWFWRWPVWAFWLMSDYGRSTGRIIVTFFALAFIFANIYYHWGRLNPPGIVSNLLVDREGVAVQWWLVPLRTLYFSIVTQTTLGFGDMYAKGQSFFGHLLLMLQVLLGYVLLGALITRFAVLFTAGGPAGEFAKQKKKVDSVSPANVLPGQASTE